MILEGKAIKAKSFFFKSNKEKMSTRFMINTKKIKRPAARESTKNFFTCKGFSHHFRGFNILLFCS